MSWIVKAGKQGKKIIKKLITPAEKHYVGYTRRIERVQTTRRICAMTFDDGPMGLPASPDRFDGRAFMEFESPGNTFPRRPPAAPETFFRAGIQACPRPSAR